MTTIRTPTFIISNRPVSALEIDMWNITGQYADGAWHQLIHASVKHWAEKKQFAGIATIWSSTMPSANFGEYTNTCVIAAFSMGGFINQLETTLSDHFPRQVRRAEDMQVVSGSWRPYLHLEHGKIWTALDTAEWAELE